jgi:hypothetical protein
MAASIAPADRMLIEWECDRLVRRFAMLNDDRDHDGLAALFVEDARFSRPLAPESWTTGREAIRALFRDRPPRLARHIMTNTLVDVVSATEAKGRTYMTFVSTTDLSKTPPVAEPVLMYGQFDDLFVLEEGEWRFKERRGSVALRFEAKA